jgi:hypothetical protein
LGAWLDRFPNKDKNKACQLDVLSQTKQKNWMSNLLPIHIDLKHCMMFPKQLQIVVLLSI